MSTQILYVYTLIHSKVYQLVNVNSVFDKVTNQTVLLYLVKLIYRLQMKTQWPEVIMPTEIIFSIMHGIIISTWCVEFHKQINNNL